MKDPMDFIREDAKAEGVPDLEELMQRGGSNRDVLEAVLPGFTDYFTEFLQRDAKNVFKGYMAEATVLTFRAMSLNCVMQGPTRDLLIMAFALGRYSAIKAKT